MDGYAPSGEVWHFSEDPAIERFAPHVAATAKQPEAYVWACPPERCPDYWFPRQCPRAIAWRGPSTPADVADRLLGPGIQRRHVIERDWLERFESAVVYAYPFPAKDFRPIGDPPHAVVAVREVAPLRPAQAIGPLPELHRNADIPLDVVDDMFGWWHEVIASGLEFSGIRLKNSTHYRDPS